MIKFKSHLYYEEKDEHSENLKKLKELNGSKITFYKNGKSLGAAYQDIYAGEYFPGVGLYKNAHIKYNFGPKFKFRPEEAAAGYKPLCDRVKELEVEQTMADMLYFTDHEGKLRIDNYYIAN